MFQVFISKILNLSFKHNVPLFLTDQKIFKHILNGTLDDSARCRVLCVGQKVTHFATIGPVSTQIQKVNALSLFFIPFPNYSALLYLFKIFQTLIFSECLYRSLRIRGF